MGLPAGDRHTNELGDIDSDGDGHGNALEFEAGTNPGDSSSRPAG